MKKLINAVDAVLAESLDGFAAAHADILTMGEERKFVRRRTLKPGKVGLISGGGSGHEPLHAGFVGLGMLDAACPGQVFTSPTPDQMLAAAEAVDTGAGVLFIVKNYEGDVMNFAMAAEMAGREVATVDHRRRRGGGELDLHHRPARRRRHADRRAHRRRGGRAGARPRRAPGAGRGGERAHPLDGRGAELLHRAGCRHADLHARRGRDGDGRRHPWRARPAPGQARERRRHRRGDAGLGPEGSRAQARRRGAAAGQRLRRHAADGALPHGRQCPARAGGAGVKAVRFLTGSYVTSLEMAGCSLTCRCSMRRRRRSGTRRCTRRPCAGEHNRFAVEGEFELRSAMSWLIDR